MRDEKILKFLYSKKNDGQLYDVSLIFKNSVAKHEIDNWVIEMEKNGYVAKKVKGYLSERAVPPGGDKSDANNSLCKITPKGIEYYENFKSRRDTTLLAVISLILSFIAIVFTALTYFNRN